jgi:hypothetical protein
VVPNTATMSSRKEKLPCSRGTTVARGTMPQSCATTKPVRTWAIGDRHNQTQLFKDARIEVDRRR